MVRLQEFIKEHYSKNTTIIDINKQENIKETVDGDELDLTEYSNIETLRINSKILKTPLKKLTVKSRALKRILILNSPELDGLDVSECSSLRLLVVNGKQIVTIEDCSEKNITGWEHTELISKELREIAEILKK